jgi:hypothetical protein
MILADSVSRKACHRSGPLSSPWFSCLARSTESSMLVEDRGVSVGKVWMELRLSGLGKDVGAMEKGEEGLFFFGEGGGKI